MISAGQDGYLIVDGIDDLTPGGKIKVPNYSGVTDGYVLTKTTTDGTDDVVWSAPGGGSILDDVATWESTYDHKTVEEYLSLPDSKPLELCELKITVKKENNTIKYRPLFYAGTASFLGPWSS